MNKHYQLSNLIISLSFSFIIVIPNSNVHNLLTSSLSLFKISFLNSNGFAKLTLTLRPIYSCFLFRGIKLVFKLKISINF